MPKSDEYRAQLRALKDWAPYLRRESGLPGPRGNLELAQGVAEEAIPRQIESLLSIPSDRAPENSANVFVVFCGVTALGRRAALGERQQLARLKTYANDPRWRVREAVAIGLQYYGDADIGGLLSEMRRWCKGSWFEMRAAAAALAEPRLLTDARIVRKVLQILDAITRDIERTQDSKSEPFRSLRQTMGYCWSVAIAASPGSGKPLLEKWLQSPSADVRWIMKENLARNRLVRMDAAWVKASTRKLRPHGRA